MITSYVYLSYGSFIKICGNNKNWFSFFHSLFCWFIFWSILYYKCFLLFTQLLFVFILFYLFFYPSSSVGEHLVPGAHPHYLLCEARFIAWHLKDKAFFAPAMHESWLYLTPTLKWPCGKILLGGKKYG